MSFAPPHVSNCKSNAFYYIFTAWAYSNNDSLNDYIFYLWVISASPVPYAAGSYV